MKSFLNKPGPRTRTNSPNMTLVFFSLRAILHLITSITGHRARPRSPDDTSQNQPTNHPEGPAALNKYYLVDIRQLDDAVLAEGLDAPVAAVHAAAVPVQRRQLEGLWGQPEPQGPGNGTVIDTSGGGGSGIGHGGVGRTGRRCRRIRGRAAAAVARRVHRDRG